MLRVLSALLFVFLFCSEAYSSETIDLSKESGLIRVTAGTPLDDDVLEETEDGLFFDQIDGTLAPTQAPVFSAVTVPTLEFVDYLNPFEFFEPKVPLSKSRYGVYYSRPPPEARAFYSIFSYGLAQNLHKNSLLFVGIYTKSIIGSFARYFNQEIIVISSKLLESRHNV